MSYYETELMTKKQTEEFEDFLNDKVGTDYEVNWMDKNEGYLIILDLETDEEFSLVREHELALDPPSYQICKWLSKGEKNEEES
jgi:hypothetical protein